MFEYARGMTALTTAPRTPHQLARAALARLNASLDDLAVGLAGAGRGEAAAVVPALDRALTRLQALKLAAVAAADRDDVARGSGLPDTGAWLAARTHATGAAAARELSLATALDDRLPATRAALHAGEVSSAHAAVIAAATRQLPATLAQPERERIELGLVAQARRVDPARLRKAARRALLFAERSAAEVAAHEDEMLRAEEDRAWQRARLTMHDNLDGTTSGHFTVPTFAGQVLRKTLQQLASPRRGRGGVGAPGRPGAAGDTAGGSEVGPVSIVGDGIDAGLDWAHRYGQAFTQLLERLPTDRLHGKVAATVVVTLDLERLRDAVNAQPAGAAVDTGTELSAGQVRRLACEAGLVPAVLGGQSLPLDLGRAQRFYTEAQRVALATVYDECAAVGCDRPYAWSELHHEDPWHAGGSTDLDLAVPLCGWHHRRVHDPTYRHTVETDRGGRKTVTFHRRS
jgi:hypothetical protein